MRGRLAAHATGYLRRPRYLSFLVRHQLRNEGKGLAGTDGVSASVNGDVTLTFTVTNPSADPVKVVFPSGQKYNLWATDSTTGKSVWTWSADKLFALGVVEETVPAGGSLTFVEKWTPPKSGLYLVRAALTSTSHRSEAYASFVVP